MPAHDVPPLARRLLAELLGSAFLAALVIGSGIAAQLVGGACAILAVRALYPDLTPDEAAEAVMPHHESSPAAIGT